MQGIWNIPNGTHIY